MNDAFQLHLSSQSVQQSGFSWFWPHFLGLTWSLVLFPSGRLISTFMSKLISTARCKTSATYQPTKKPQLCYRVRLILKLNVSYSLLHNNYATRPGALYSIWQDWGAIFPRYEKLACAHFTFTKPHHWAKSSAVSIWGEQANLRWKNRNVFSELSLIRGGISLLSTQI